MPRIRTIKPQFFLNEELAALPAMVRLLFIGLWTQADREGRLLDRPKRLKAEIFPYDNFDIEKGLTQLSDAGFIFRYKVNVNDKADVNISDRVSAARVLAPEQPITELALIQIINFSKHQKIDRINERESDLPEINKIDYNKSIDSLPIVQEGKGREGKGDIQAPAPDLTKSNLYRQPEIPELETVLRVFIQHGGTAEMAQKFYNKHSSTGWFFNGSPIKNFASLVPGCIKNWAEINKKNVWPENGFDAEAYKKQRKKEEAEQRKNY